MKKGDFIFFFLILVVISYIACESIFGMMGGQAVVYNNTGGAAMFQVKCFDSDSESLTYVISDQEYQPINLDCPE